MTTTTMSSSSLVLTGNTYDNFVNSIKSEATMDRYIYALKKYMKYQNITNVNDLTTSQDVRLITAKIIDYIVYLKQNRKISSATIAVYVSAVIHFYSMNDVTLNRKKIGMYIGEFVRKQKDRAYTTEEIRLLLDFCDERSKALVLLMASTGSIPDLELRHISKIKEEYILYKIIIYEGTKEEYYCFTTPEAAKAIDTYLDYRERYGEELTSKSPLFRKQFDINDVFDARHPEKLSIKGMAKLLMDKLHRSGVIPLVTEKEGDVKGKWRNSVARAHGFRKFVTTNMIRAKVNAEAREMLLGHSIGLNKAYYRPEPEDLLEEYMKAVDLLTINEENRLKRKVVELTQKADRFDCLEEKIQRLTKKLGLE